MIKLCQCVTRPQVFDLFSIALMPFVSFSHCPRGQFIGWTMWNHSIGGTKSLFAVLTISETTKDEKHSPVIEVNQGRK